MSYVLDALKKLEFEKARKVLDGSATGISGDLFRDGPSRLERNRRWPMVLVVGAAIAVSCIGTWFVLRNGSKSVTSASTQVERIVPPVIAVPAAPPASQTVLPPTVSSQPAPSLVVTTAPEDAAVTEPGLDEDGHRSHRRRGAVQAKGAQVGQTAPSAAPKQGTVLPPADIKVSGIAWQDEHGLRRAVVNGFLLQEGAVVAGARISDILPDRVKFSSPNGAFIVRMDAAATASQPH